MVVPEFAEAPVIPPVIVPIVQAKVPATLDVSAIFGPVPLHILAVGVLVTIGAGYTVTVIANGVPVQDPVVEVGVTRYITDPDVILLGLVST
jgi:hypothetical protein